VESQLFCGYCFVIILLMAIEYIEGSDLMLNHYQGEAFGIMRLVAVLGEERTG